MQNITETVRITLLLSSYILMGVGVIHDIKDRRYPNTILGSIIILGLVYAMYSGHLLESIIGFFLINVMGIICHKYRFISAGDMKYLSTIFLFISIRDYMTCIFLMVYMLFITFIFGYYFYKRNNKNYSEELKKQMFSYKALFMFRINTFSNFDYKSKEEMLKKSIPYTLPIYLSYIFASLTSLLLC